MQRHLNHLNFKLKPLKWALHFRGKFSLLNSACHPELVEDASVPPGQEGKGLKGVWSWFCSISNSPPGIQDQPLGITQGDTRKGLHFSLRNCECSCRNHYWRIFHGIKDFREGWAELFREISSNTLKEQHTHSGSHLKGAPSKRDEAKEERICQEKKAPNRRKKKKDLGEKQWHGKFWGQKNYLNM